MKTNKWIDRAWETGKPFEEPTNKSLNLVAQALLSVGSHQFDRELPELNAVWRSVLARMDEAEAAGVYQPTDDLRKIIQIARARARLDAEYEAAPWVRGPARVVVDPAAEPVRIPRGLRYLFSTDRVALQERMAAI